MSEYDDLRAAVQHLTAGELAFMTERATMYARLEHDGAALVGSALLAVFDVEKGRRTRENALTRARFDAIAAELRNPPEGGPLGDVRGIPPWGGVSL